tara:strand:- start:84 stop:404 length:321 start_codon:yes stop_codon:yes gene_type:complete
LGKGTGITSSETTKTHYVGGARGYSVLVKLTDNGGAAGSVSLRAGLSKDDMIIDAGTVAAMAFTTGVQRILYNISAVAYGIVDVDIIMAGGDLDYEVFITVIEGES